MKVKRFIEWLPGIISELIAVIFCIIYAVTDGSKTTMYAELIVSALLPFAFPVYGAITKKPLPLILPAVSTVFVFCACGLGSAIGLYDKVHCWDLILHGIFGFVCSLTVFVLLVRWNGSKLNPVGFIVIIFAFTLGVAALWEVWEYIADRFTGADAQRVAESVALGKSPLADTMEDVMIAMAGSALFLVTFIIDKFRGYKTYSRLCGFNGFEKCSERENQV
ncbi:MAG: hypothetical protein K2N23_02270 [Clostridia bacterium]|nr:hypothetical protein [Clostridia bacterium]